MADSPTQKMGWMLETTVFVCGALVMIYEIIGSRIVSPFIGTSTYVWTSLIGVILGALSLGYWIGGTMADKKPKASILASAIFTAGALVSLTILTRDPILALIAEAPIPLEVKSMLAAILLFAPASVALGFVIPYAVKLRTTSLADSGKTVGRLYALSTIGSIAGTFAAGFILIPFAGSIRTLYLIAALLFLIALLLAPFTASRANIGAMVLFGVAVAGSELADYAQFRLAALNDIDTEYNRIRIFETTDPENLRPLRVMMIDPYFVQSAIYLDGDDPALKYSRFYHLARHYNPDFASALMIGGAGYTFPREFLRTYPRASMDVVEIDPGMTRAARKFFGLVDDPRLRIYHQDGRMFINSGAAESYDVVFMDAFSSLFSVPYHLTTIEAVRQIHSILKSDGVVIFNLGSALTGDSGRFFQAEFATYRAVFPDVLVFQVNAKRAPEELQNLIIVARKTDSPAAAPADPQIAELLSHRADTAALRAGAPAAFPAAEISNQAILTDDLAPVEYFNSLAQRNYRPGQ